MAQSTSALLGMTALSAGAFILVGVIKNRQPFGRHGFVTQAVQTGKIADITTAPKIHEFPQHGETAVFRLSPTVQGAVDRIKAVDPSLGENLQRELNTFSTDIHDYDYAKSLLALAEQEGLQAEVAIVRTYIAFVTSTTA
jgi:hypothetical protein